MNSMILKILGKVVSVMHGANAPMLGNYLFFLTIKSSTKLTIEIIHQIIKLIQS